MILPTVFMAGGNSFSDRLFSARHIHIVLVEDFSGSAHKALEGGLRVGPHHLFTLLRDEDVVIGFTFGLLAEE